MAAEKGSVLVTVLGLGIVMTIAAGSLLITASAASGHEDRSWQRLKCFHDAESGLLVGTGWLRRQAVPWDPDLDGSAAPTFDLSPVLALQNGCNVTVSISEDPADANRKTVRARAVSGATAVTVSWDVRVQANAPPALPDLQVTNWQAPIPAERP